MTRVITETMRMSSPVWMLPRRTVQDTEVGGHRIPAGSYVFYSAYANHHDPRLFPPPGPPRAPPAGPGGGGGPPPCWRPPDAAAAAARRIRIRSARPAACAGSRTRASPCR
ncbi:cytochrome P450 [Nocardia wallacei]|uniref:cytochrome P450 n=1 Tax=Nocardia wallacei TaxID=480035 RepID=UPI003CC7ED49